MSLSAEAAEVAESDLLNPKLRDLLDHIAVELAHEYIRLMEAAARDESAGGVSVRDA
jgi:hypothetical protein